MPILWQLHFVSRSKFRSTEGTRGGCRYMAEKSFLRSSTPVERACWKSRIMTRCPITRTTLDLITVSVFWYFSSYLNVTKNDACCSIVVSRESLRGCLAGKEKLRSFGWLVCIVSRASDDDRGNGVLGLHGRLVPGTPRHVWLFHLLMTVHQFLLPRP
jgi:hypothetical protein